MITNLKGISYEVLAEAFDTAFADYFVKFKMTAEILERLMVKEGFCPELSGGYFDNGKLVGFILNGYEERNGEKCIYDAGTGVIPEYRGKKITDQIYEFVKDNAISKGIDKYYLEVIQENEKAFKIYKDKGFEITRNLLCYHFDKENFGVPEVSEDIEIIKAETPDFDLYETFFNSQPTWQNSINSMKRTSEKINILESKENGETTGYIIYSNNYGIYQFGVRKDKRNKGIGRALFGSVIKDALTAEKSPAIINIDERDGETVNFLNKIGFKDETNQYEMVNILK